MRAVRLRAGLQIRGRRACVRLRHAEAHHHAAGEAFGEPFLLLIVGAVFGEGADRPEVAELHHVGAARAYRRGLLDGDHRVHQRAALAAVGFGNGDAHQSLLAHQLGDVERESRFVGTLERVLLELRLREAVYGIRECLLLFGEAELHCYALKP